MWQKTPVSLVALLLVPGMVATARVAVAPIFSDHMVLQQERPIPVWGTADPGEEIAVSFDGRTWRGVAGDDGRWEVVLPSMPAAKAGRVLTVTGENTWRAEDVVVGDVWLCSGQSNMDWPLAQSDGGPEEINASGDKGMLRLFKLPYSSDIAPQVEVKAQWAVATQESLKGFSGVAYFFGDRLNRELAIPIGLINASWGGTRIEPWIPAEGFQAIPELAAIRAARHEPQDPQQPTVIYNGILNPIAPFALRGAIWYQGESNVSDEMLYKAKLEALVRGWRLKFRNPELPFYLVELAPFHYGDDGGMLPRFWEAQRAFAESEPHTAMAVINDIGNPADIHPTDKKTVGNRLAALALQYDYGQIGLAAEAPVAVRAAFLPGKVEVRFKHAEILASADGEAIRYFEVAGADGVWFSAVAALNGNLAVVTCDRVAEPRMVRYAWDQAIKTNLVNEGGVPADAFRMGTAGNSLEKH